MATIRTNQRVEDKSMEDHILNWNLEENDATIAIRKAISRDIARRCWGMIKKEVILKMERLRLLRENNKMVIFLLCAWMWAKGKAARNRSWILGALITCVLTEIGSRTSRKPMGEKSSWETTLLAKLEVYEISNWRWLIELLGYCGMWDIFRSWEGIWFP